MQKSDSSAPAYRGKKPEARVKAYFERLAASRADFDWERKYDAHSAGGRFQRQIYDFAFFAPGVHGGIEVKEVAHDFRVPYKNFKPEQVAGLRKRMLCGAHAAVVVFHSTSGLWRLCPPEVFFSRPPEAGSWDLRDIVAELTCHQVLDHFFRRILERA